MGLFLGDVGKGRPTKMIRQTSEEQVPRVSTNASSNGHWTAQKGPILT